MKDIKAAKDAAIPQYRAALVRAGILGASFHLSDPAVFMFPVIDYLQLLFQPTPEEDPIAFLAWKDHRCIYSSFADLYYCRKYSLSPEHLTPPAAGICVSQEQDLWLTVHRIRSATLRDFEHQYSGSDWLPPDSNRQFEILSPDPSAMECTKTVLVGDTAASGTTWLGLTSDDAARVRDLLVESLLRPRPPQAAGRISDMPTVDYIADALPYLESFREVLDDVFREARESQMLQFPEHTPQLGNVFCAVRTVCSPHLRLSAFPYSAGLLLSRQQREDFVQWCDARGKNCSVAKDLGLARSSDCLSALETPLGLNSRSVADVVFSSGVIDFGRVPGDNVWDRCDPESLADQRRFTVEKCIYPHPEASLYYVPVHVQGMPWLAFFTFASLALGKEAYRWLQNYTFYRDIMQRAAATLRLLAEREYTRQLGTIAAREMSDWQWTPEEVVSHVNHSWRQLACVFPFPLFRIALRKDGEDAKTANGSTSFTLEVSGRGKWILTGEDNPFFGTPQVTWRRSNPGDLLPTVVHGIHAQLADRLVVSIEETSKSLAISTHIIDTPLDALRTTIDSIQNANDRSMLLAEWEDLRSFADFAMAVGHERRRDEILQKMQRVSVSELTSIVRQCLGQAFAMLSHRRAPRVTNVDPREVFQCLLSNEDKDLYYHPTQLRAVVNELTANALRRMDASNPFLKVELCGLSGTGDRGAFLRVVNGTGRPFDEVTVIANAIGASQNKLGITTVRLGCKACGYAPPQWTPERHSDGSGLLCSHVQIAAYSSEGQ